MNSTGIEMSRDKAGVSPPITVHRKQKIGKNLYSVKEVYLGKYDLAKILEDSAIRRILREENIGVLQVD